MRGWWGEGAGFRIALVEAVDIHSAVFDIRPDVVAAVVALVVPAIDSEWAKEDQK